MERDVKCAVYVTYDTRHLIHGAQLLNRTEVEGAIHENNSHVVEAEQEPDSCRRHLERPIGRACVQHVGEDEHKHEEAANPKVVAVHDGCDDQGCKVRLP